MERDTYGGRGISYHDMIYGQYAERPWKSAPTVTLVENLSLIISNEPG